MWRRYEGAWVRGQRHGEGVCAYANGDMYDGAWEAGARCGKGTCAYAEGGKYTGYLMHFFREPDLALSLAYTRLATNLDLCVTEVLCVTDLRLALSDLDQAVNLEETRAWAEAALLPEQATGRRTSATAGACASGRTARASGASGRTTRGCRAWPTRATPAPRARACRAPSPASAHCSPSLCAPQLMRHVIAAVAVMDHLGPLGFSWMATCKANAQRLNMPGLCKARRRKAKAADSIM